MRCGFTIKKPSDTRRTFAVHKKIYRAGQPPLQPQVKDERINAINTSLRAGVLSVQEALLQIKSVIEKIKIEEGIGDKLVAESQISEKNLKLYTAYMAENYEGRKLVRPERVPAEFNFALLRIEPLSLISATKKELQKKVDSAFDDKQQRYVGRINQLLMFAGRDFQLHPKKKRHSVVSFLTYKELKEVLAHVQEPDLKNLYTTLFCTGARLGEAFVWKERDIKPNGTLYVQLQMTEKLEIREIKNRKPHHTVIINEGVEAVRSWCALPHKRKEELRTRCQHPLINAARKTFDDSERQVSPHDLRHSYAIHMLGLGVPLDKVAKLIGDTLKATEEYYAAFTMSDNEIDFVQSIIGKSR